MSLLGFGVKNLRCLTDTGIVPIKPITLLVGRNSSGKSTFLRAFPLLRQSVEAPRESPILWYDPQFVDFGSFADAVNHRADDGSITFRFRLEGQDTGLWTEEGSIFDVSMTLSKFKFRTPEALGGRRRPGSILGRRIGSAAREHVGTGSALTGMV